MDNSLHVPHLYSSNYQTHNHLYDGLYGADNEIETPSPKESQVLSENNPSTSSLPYRGLHRPARLDWHQVGKPLGKNFANDVWLKTRRVLASSDSDNDTNSKSHFHNEMLEYPNPFAVQSSPCSTPTTTYTDLTRSQSTSTMKLNPAISPKFYCDIASRKQDQDQFVYLILHDAVPVAAESLATTTVTGVYATLEEANGFVERIAEGTCRDVPEEHFKLLVEEDGEYGFDILDMQRHMLHRVYIEKQSVRGIWSEKAEIEKTGVIRSQAEDEAVFDELAKLSL